VTGDAATLAFADLQPEDIVATLDDLGFDCDGRFLALNSYENRVYQIGIEDERPVVAKFYRPRFEKNMSLRWTLPPRKFLSCRRSRSTAKH